MFISQIVYVSARFRRRYAECFISHAVIVASFFAAVETSKIIHALRLHKSCDDFIFKRNGELESCRAVLLLYSTWQSKSDVFQHCLRTFRLCLSTFCVSFNTCCAHSYCIPALPHAEKNPNGAHYACISMCSSTASRGNASVEMHSGKLSGKLSGLL